LTAAKTSKAYFEVFKELLWMGDEVLATVGVRVAARGVDHLLTSHCTVEFDGVGWHRVCGL
jgi:hypothetical protein